MKTLILVALLVGCDTLSPKRCWNGLQKDYRGNIGKTISEFTCQRWTQQRPHEHSRTVSNYPGAGLGDHNYCRNPDNESGGAWCYTTNRNQRWDYCPIPKCSTGEPICWNGLQKDYRGNIGKTITKFTCQKWTQQRPHEHDRTVSNYPGTGLGNHNYCRNPDNESGGAWCYTTNPNKRWDYCPVPNCSTGEASCWNGLQKDYRGPVEITQYGERCQRWTHQSPHEHSITETNYPGTGLGNHNYCRNPSNKPGGAWCYTTNPNQIWDYCPIPKCT